ncbi:Jag N-terminal domain-containing protein [Thermodesulfobacteriota bacterium]
MREVEFKGTDIDDALQKASDELKLTADNIVFDIVAVGSKGFLGVIGKKPAIIKVHLKDGKGSSSKGQKEFSRPEKRGQVKTDKGHTKDRDQGQRRDTQKKDAPKRDAQKKDTRRKDRQPKDGQRQDTRKKEFQKPDAAAEVVEINVAPEKIEELQRFVDFVVKRLDETAKVAAAIKNNKIHISIDCENSGKIIGKGGRIISSVEYLTIKFARKVLEEKVKIIVEVEGGRKSKR